MRVGDMADYVKGIVATTEPRTGLVSPRLDEAEFKRRFRSQFKDPAFEVLDTEVERTAGGCLGCLRAPAHQLANA